MTAVDPFPLPGIVVEPQGQTATVNVYDRNSNLATVYADAFAVTQVTLPKIVAARTTFFPVGDGPWTVTVSVGGVQVVSTSLILEDNQVGTVTVPAGYSTSAVGGFGGFANTECVYVNPAGSDSLSGISPLNAKLTLAGAMNALPAGGGRIYIAGAVAPGSASTLDLAASTWICGTGMSTSSISWTADLGANTPGILCFGGNGNQRSVITDITLSGPAGNANPTIGTAPANMWGVETNSKTTLQRVFCQGFYAGICIGSNHESVIDCESHGCWYNMFWVNTSNQGNQTLINVDLYTAARASMGIKDQAAISSANLQMVGCGQTPFGIWVEARSNSNSWLVFSTLTECGFESIGNECVHDATTGHAGPGINAVTWSFGGAVAYSGSYNDSGQVSNYGIYSSIGAAKFVDLANMAGPSGGKGAFGNPAGNLDLAPASVSTVFGDCSSGPCIFDGTSTVAGLVPSTNVYTMNANIFATTVEVKSGVTLKTANYVLCAAVSITVDSGGTIDNSGAAGAAGGTGGATPGNAVFAAAGGGAGVSSGNGGGGGGSNLGAGCGNSGAGGNGSTGTGGGGSSANSNATFLYKNPALFQTGIVGWGGVARLLGGTSGGGGGSGDGTNHGGGGGASGGILALVAPSVINNGTLSANGGNGGTPSTGNCGGGGAGAGGCIVAYTMGSFTQGTTSVVAGTPGSGVGSGASGGTGTSGTVLSVSLVG